MSFVANLSLSLAVKECCRSVSIWGSYGQEFSVRLLDDRSSHCVTDRQTDGTAATVSCYAESRQK